MDEEDLLTSVGPLLGVMCTFHSGLGWGGSEVALRHVVLCFFSFLIELQAWENSHKQLTHTPSSANRSESYRNKSNSEKFIAAISTDFTMLQIPALNTTALRLWHLLYIPLGISHALGVVPPPSLTPLTDRGRRNRHNWSSKFGSCFLF